jgi:DNA-binding response OmpR family regulator
MKADILLVDDEEAIRQSLGEILQLEGYAVTAAESGEAAIQLLKKRSFDLILLDLKMPGVSGEEVLKTAHKIAPETKVIILTAHGSIESAIEALHQEAHDYIQKPSTSREILNSVARGLAIRAENQRKRLILEQLGNSIQQLKEAERVDYNLSMGQYTTYLEGGVVLDLDRREIWLENQKIKLTPTEGKLMKVLVENRGRVLSHRELVLLVHGYETTDREAPEVLRPLISRLRRKLVKFPNGENWISNVRGTGYIFD